jgi:hypothetical protein
MSGETMNPGCKSPYCEPPFCRNCGFTVRLRDDGLWTLSYHGREQFTFPTESEALAALEMAAWSVA